jgi:hypothetical protein
MKCHIQFTCDFISVVLLWRVSHAVDVHLLASLRDAVRFDSIYKLFLNSREMSSETSIGTHEKPSLWLRFLRLTLLFIHISLIRDYNVTTQTLWFFSRNFKGFEMLYFSMLATTTQLLSSGEFCKLRYVTIPVKKCICKRFFLYQ